MPARGFLWQSVTIVSSAGVLDGVAKVLLVGMDFSYQIPADAKVDGNIIVSQSDDPNHLILAISVPGKRDQKLSRVLQNYRLAKKFLKLMVVRF